MGISTSTGTLIAGQSRTFNLSPASAVTLTLSPNARITITETPATVAATGLGGNASRVHEPRLPGVVTYGPYPMGGSVLVENESNSGSTVTWVRSDSIIAESADGVQSLVDGAGNLVFGDKLVQLFGDDEMIIGTFANRPIATTVAVGKEFMATDLGNARWVSDGTQWILLKPSMLVGEPTQASITDTVGQATTESTLLTLNIPANALGSRDGLLLDLIWSCTNTAAAKRIRGRFGGTVLFNVDLTTHLVFRQSIKLRNRNSQAAQVSQGNSTTNFGPIGSVGVQTFTVDFATAQVLTITGQFPVTGSGANTLALEEATINAI